MTNAGQREAPRLSLQPISIGEAQTFVGRHHRHHKAPQGALFAVACSAAEQVVAVATIGRPVARMLQDGWTAEVTRLCALEGHPNACSMLYAAAWRACRALGYRRLITYVLASERGVSVAAAGWREVGKAGGGTWLRPSRPTVDRHPLEQKVLWERLA